MQHFLVSLDAESIKIWEKIPKGDRSRFVREKLKGYKEEDTAPKSLTDLIFSNTSKKSEEKHKGSSSQENKSYVTGRTTRANKKKKSSAYRKESITSLLSKLWEWEKFTHL